MIKLTLDKLIDEPGTQRFCMEMGGITVRGFRLMEGRIEPPITYTKRGVYKVVHLTRRAEDKLFRAIKRANQRAADGDPEWEKSLILR